MVKVLDCKSVVSDCAANDFDDDTKEEPSCESEKEDSKCRIIALKTLVLRVIVL